PARPLTGSVCGQPTEKEKEDQGQQRVAALVGSARMKKAAEGPLLLLLLLFFFSSVGGRHRDLSEVGGVGPGGVSAPWMARLSLI
ncbi:TPA: hypothetical protein ACOFD1_004450, partial [Stenotrophomonas maltophilia]